MIRRIMRVCIPSVLCAAMLGLSLSPTQAALPKAEATTWTGGEECDAVFSRNTNDSAYAYAGKPISLVSGAETLSRTDLTIGSIYPIVIERKFNSLSTYDSPSGYGWALNHDRRLYTYADGSVTLRRDCGGKRRFFPSGDPSGEVYESTTSERGTLVHNTAEDTFTYTDGSGYQDVYDNRGRLIALVDPSGNSQVITYTDITRLLLRGMLPANLDQSTPVIVAYDYRIWTIEERSAASGMTGAKVTFTYDFDGRLRNITDSGARSVNYDYDYYGNLRSVTSNNMNLNHLYTYGDQYSKHHLITIDQGEGLYTNAYHSDGWIYQQKHTGQDSPTGVIDIEYLEPGVRAKVTTTVADKNGAVLNRQVRITEFDSGKRVATTTDSYGNLTKYMRDPLTFAVTREEHWENTGSVDSPNLVLKTATDFSYENGNLLTKTEAQGTPQEKTTTYTYDPVYSLVTSATVSSVVFPALVSTITNSYYSTGKLKARTEEGYLGDGTPYNYQTSYTYYSTGKLWAIDGPRTDVSDVTSYEYTPQGFLWKVTTPIGTTTYDGYNSLGLPGTVTDVNGNIASYTYYPDGRVWTVRATLSENPTQYCYEPNGCSSASGGSKLDHIIMPEGNAIYYSYDGNGNLTKIRDSQSNGNSINYTYDSEGNKLSEQINDSQGGLQKSLGYGYDALNRLQQITNPDGYTGYSYDGMGNRATLKTPNGPVTSYTYDALNRLKTVTQPPVLPETSIVTIYVYDTNNNLTSVTDAKNHTTGYIYDDKGRVYQVISPDTGTTTYTYDPAGNMVSKLDAKNITINYSYDAANRLTLISSAAVEGLSAFSVTYTYDTCLNGKGRLCTMTDASGTTSYKYSSKGQIVEEHKSIVGISGGPHIIGYSYDQNGNMKTMTYPSGKVIAYNYTNDRAVSVLNGAANLATNIAYKPFGGMTGITYGNGLVGSIGYEEQNHNYRITSIATTGVINLSYPTYDSNGNIGAINDTLDSTKNKSFAYDALDRLWTATTGTWNFTWTYDGVGNRSSYTYVGGSNKLNIANGLSYGYDNNGNTTAEGARQFVYNQNQRLIRVIDGSTTKGEYTYNGNGQRVKKVTASGTTIFHYSLSGQIIAESDSAGTITAEYVYLNGQLLAKMEGGNTYYYHNDHLGTPQKMTDTSGTVVWAADYKPFGEATVTVSTITNNLRFPGQYFDQETNLHYNYYRDYSPAIGRYVESDPIGLRAGLNLYAYVENNPAKFTDLLGLDYSLSEYHILVPGSEDWNNKNQKYNCMAWGVGSDVWQQDKDPQKVPPKFGCNQVDCNSECKQCQNKIKIYEDKSDYTKWHVYKQVDGQWSCKYGRGALAAVLDPGKDYVDVYKPKGKITEACWCCPK